MPSKCSGCVLLCQHILYGAIVFFASNSRARTLAFTHSFIHTLTHNTKKNTSNFKMLKISAAVAPILFLCIREFHALNYLPVSCSIPTMQTLSHSHKNSTEKIKRAAKSGLSIVMMTLLVDAAVAAAFQEMTM